MDDENKLTGKELGIYLGMLIGIAVLQTSGQILGLAILPPLGFVFGNLLDQMTSCINTRRTWIEEE